MYDNTTPLSNIVKKYKIPALILIILFIILLVTYFAFLSSKAETLRINNLSSFLPTIPKENKTQLEKLLFSQTKNDTNRSVYSGAKIRDNTFYKVETPSGVTVGRFIVDIPKAEESYYVTYIYGKNNEQEIEINGSIGLYCLNNPESIIYENSKCSDNSSLPSEDNSYQLILKNATPYTSTLDTGEPYTINYVFLNNNNSFLEATATTCKNSEILETSLVNVTKNWLASLGFNNQEGFKIMTDTSYNECLIK